MSFGLKDLGKSPQKNSPTVKRLDINNSMESSEPANYAGKDLTPEKEKQRFLEIGMDDSSPHYYEFKACGDKKIRINKSLFTFRITQFIWYGGGVLPSTFLGIFLKQRGLTLVQLSSIFSVIFIFQFVCSSVTGVIADKIGNARPVLKFLMFSSFLFIVSMLLTPNINSASCILQEKKLNNSEQSEHKNNFSSCYINCLFNYKKLISHEQNYTKDAAVENASFFNIDIDFEIGDSRNACNFYNVTLKKISLNFSIDDCCNSCINSSKSDCITVRNEYLVIVYAVLILVFYSVYNTTYRFMNFTAISLAEKNDSHYGKEFAIAKSADILFMIIIAFVLNIDKSSGSQINFNPVIWIAAGIMFSAFLMSFTTTASILPPGKDLTKKAFNLLRDIDTLAFILLVFVSGNGYAFYLTFHLVFLETLNAPSTVIALHSVAIYLYGFLLLLTSKWWMDKLGTNKIFILGLFFHGVNFAASSYIYNAWWSLVIDITVAFAFDLYWVAVVEHCWRAAPVGFAATYNALAGAVKYGIGRSSGVFFGGMLMHYMGPRKAYRIMAAIFFSAAVLYSIFIYMRRKCAVSK